MLGLMAMTWGLSRTSLSIMSMALSDFFFLRTDVATYLTYLIVMTDLPVLIYSVFFLSVEDGTRLKFNG